MSDPEGAIRVDLGDGRDGLLHLVRLGKDGSVRSPRNRDAFVRAAASAPDAFVFSHGWNNDYAVATRAYTAFLRGYVDQGACRGTPALLGIVWPSTTFVLPWESGPDIAGDRPPTLDEQLAGLVDDDGTRAVLADVLGDGTRDVPPQDADRAAAAVAALHPLQGDEVDDTTPTTQQVKELWAALSTDPAQAVDKWGTADEQPAGGPAAAGLRFDPRALLRALSVWKMKARAGVVGAHGVGPIVREVLAGDGARLHLTGHSFGARVVLAALSHGTDEPARRARSVLLLQPAVSRWCFAPDIGDGRPGGFAPALRRVELPVVSTYSDRDLPLHDVFHRVMGAAHVGDVDFAGSPAVERFGALGGYGPNTGLGSLVERVRPGTTYPLEPGTATRVVAVDGGRRDGEPAAITNHSDVSNATTWHLQRSLVEA